MRAIGLSALLVIVGCAIGIVSLASPPFRRLDPVTAHLRACAVAELGAAEVAAHLTGAGWSARWFARGMEQGPETSAGGGVYHTAIRDAGQGQAADLLVRARFEGAEVVMHHRLAFTAGSVSATERAEAVYVSFAPEGSGLGSADLDRAAAEADRARGERLAASDRFAAQRLALVRGVPARAALEVP